MSLVQTQIKTVFKYVSHIVGQTYFWILTLTYISVRLNKIRNNVFDLFKRMGMLFFSIYFEMMFLHTFTI